MYLEDPEWLVQKRNMRWAVRVAGSWEAGILETSQYNPCPVNFFPTLLRLQD